jgi:hypothetical protein
MSLLSAYTGTWHSLVPQTIKLDTRQLVDHCCCSLLVVIYIAVLDTVIAELDGTKVVRAVHMHTHVVVVDGEVGLA